MTRLSNPTTRTVTQRDIAERCSVSQMAVSLALRSDPGVSDETTARVLAMAVELGYDPAAHAAARRMALHKHGRKVHNHVIGLLFPGVGVQDGYHARIFTGIAQAIAGTDYGLFTAFVPASGDAAGHRLPAGFNRGEVDGVVSLFPADVLRALMAQLRGMPGFGTRPFVSMVWPTADGSSVLPDYQQSGRVTARHLLELGHRHLLHLIHDNPYRYRWGYPQDQRLAGVRAALTEAGLDPARHLHCYVMDQGWLDPGRINEDAQEGGPALIAYLRAHPAITALLAWNDAAAIHAAQALQAGGMRVPEDISLIGYDDTDPLPDACGQNRLTSVRLPLAEIGAEAVRVAIQRTTGGLREDVQCLLPAQLMVRGSTAPARTR